MDIANGETEARGIADTCSIKFTISKMMILGFKARHLGPELGWAPSLLDYTFLPPPMCPITPLYFPHVIFLAP